MLDDMYDFDCNDATCDLLQEYQNLLGSGVLDYEDQFHEEKKAKANVKATNKDVEQNEAVENILLSIFYADESMTMKEKRRDKNRISAQEGRDADKLYTEKMLVELGELVETFGLYSTYIAELKGRGICGPESTFEQRSSTHKTNLTILHARENDNCSEALSAKSTKERNRIHAQKSRRKKLKFWQAIEKEREESLLTLTEAIESTTALEISFSFLNDFRGNAQHFSKLMEIRQRLFDRSCAHQDKYKELKSRLEFRATYRVHFKF
jgi:hypothetical protein